MARRYGYWIFTVLLALWLVPSGMADLMRIPAVLEILKRLGYPGYLAPILGTSKLLAIAAILYPRTRLLREWAYAGITFLLLGAFASHCAVHDPVVIRATPMLVLGFAAGSYLLRPAQYRARHSGDSAAAGTISVR
jgi:hypothetical protein